MARRMSLPCRKEMHFAGAGKLQGSYNNSCFSVQEVNHTRIEEGTWRCYSFLAELKYSQLTADS